MSTAKKLLLAVVALAAVIVFACGFALGPCMSAWVGKGVLVDRCPAGVAPYLSVDVQRLGRGVKGQVTVTGSAQLYDDTLTAFDTVPLRSFSPTLTVVDEAGAETPVEVLAPWYSDGWEWVGIGRQSAAVILPESLPDGDYVLRVRASARGGELTVEAPLALYRPAVQHVLTDAPLYKPGQTIQARAALLEAGSLAPTEGRPGRWQVFDPADELVYEEKGRTGAYGVTDFRFPLADDAEPGVWKVGFRSGDVHTWREVEVRPFKLPRFTVELTPARPWYGKTQAVAVAGVARYTSGAPIQGAPVRVTVSSRGAWPLPNEWATERSLTTGADGAFTVDVGSIPEDLVGRVELSVLATVVEAAGESATGAATVVLSEEPVAVDAVTELDGGLVADANNRLYLRLTTPDGAVLPGAKVNLRHEWDARDPGLDAVADADGVVRFQLDPGSTVTVTEPSLPVRPERPLDPVSLGPIDDLTGDGAPLALAAMKDRLTAAWGPCAPLAVGGASGEVHLRAEAAGVRRVWGPFAPGVERCLAERAASVGVPGGGARLLRVSVTLNDPGTPAFSADLSTFAGTTSGLEDAIEDALAGVRSCASTSTSGTLPRAWVWEVAPGERSPRFAAVDQDGEASLAGTASCVERALAGVQLPAPQEDLPAAGLLRVDSQLGVSDTPTRTSPASWPGFAFVVRVEGVGEAVLRMPEGSLPPLRLRFSEIVVSPGDEVQVTALRSRHYSGTLPKELRLMQGDRLVEKVEFDPEAASGRFLVPEGVSGFASVDLEGARALLYVRPAETLALDLTGGDAWRPGEPATILVKTTGRTGPVAAGVTLAGVDQAMASLVELPAASDWARTTVLASSDQPAFGVLDAEALQTGQIKGEAALQATVLRISSLPPTQPGADSVSTFAEAAPDVETPLAAAFWPLYGEVRKAVRAWEATAGEADVLKAERMAALWEDTLTKHPAVDPFGRPLRLVNLPPDLLALTDPRVMVADARHLPEDEENWSLYVDTELR